MKLSATGSTTPFEAHPEYDGQAVCVDVTPLKKTQSTYGEKETFRMVFETTELRQDGKPYLLFSRGFTPSLHEKAALRAFLKQAVGELRWKFLQGKLNPASSSRCKALNFTSTFLEYPHLGRS